VVEDPAGGLGQIERVQSYVCGQIRHVRLDDRAEERDLVADVRVDPLLVDPGGARYPVDSRAAKSARSELSGRGSQNAGLGAGARSGHDRSRYP